MPSDNDKTRLALSRQKFAELKEDTEHITSQSDTVARMLREGRIIALSSMVLRRSAANLESVVRLQGGLGNTLQQVFSELRATGVRGLGSKIYRRLSEQIEYEPAPKIAENTSLYDKKTPFSFKAESEYDSAYEAYLANRDEHRKIAVFRAVAGGYDQILGYDHYLDQADYFTFTDEPADVRSQNMPLPYFDVSPTRRARFVKLHPHLLFPHHDVAVWHDGNVMIRDDITPLINAVISSNLPIGTFLHPVRDDVYDEAQACLEIGKDKAELILDQMERYSEEGFLSDRLVESNFVVYNLKHPELRPILTNWWAELDGGSYRDQLSFNYAVDRAGSDFFPLAPRPTCVRNHPSFAFFANHGDQNRQRETKKAKQVFDQTEISNEHRTQKNTDVLVCVHNALEDVKECLQSVVSNRDRVVKNIIIVDDGSDEETKQWLEAFAASEVGVTLHRNENAGGYTKAANKAISLSSADNIILLNSDAIVGSQAIEKMVACMARLEGCGIVGPLSNAASYQSIPHHLSAAGQTAINALPDNYSVDEIDEWCAANSNDLPSPGVPFVHGFCMGVKRQVFDQIGTFDEASFPFGYGEENDFCIRAADNGFRLNIAIDAFVFHAKSKSYSNSDRRKSLMNAGSAKLHELHGTERVNRLVQSMQNNPVLATMRKRALTLYS